MKNVLFEDWYVLGSVDSLVQFELGYYHSLAFSHDADPELLHTYIKEVLTPLLPKFKWEFVADLGYYKNQMDFTAGRGFRCRLPSGRCAAVLLSSDSTASMLVVDSQPISKDDAEKLNVFLERLVRWLSIEAVINTQHMTDSFGGRYGRFSKHLERENERAHRAAAEYQG